MWDAVAPLAVAPSPKSHAYAATARPAATTAVLLKLNVSEAIWLADIVTVGAGEEGEEVLAVTDLVTVADSPALSVTVKRTVYVPEAL